MQKIIVMNAKGGCGKTTIATNLAALYATHGYGTALIDYDPQGSSSAWLKRRPASSAAIHGVSAYQSSGWSVTRSWQMRMPADVERVVVDTPAGVKAMDLTSYLKDVNTIIVPVLSSVIDVDASVQFLHELMKSARVKSSQVELVVVASRVRMRSPALKVMVDMFGEMNVPVVGHLRDTLNYLQCTDVGLGVHDLPDGRAQMERRALLEIVSTFDGEFEKRQQPAGMRQRMAEPQHNVALSIPQAAVASRYGHSWK